MLNEKETKIATPPKRGSGTKCRCLSFAGTATHPRCEQKSRTQRVRTNEKASDEKKIAKITTVN
jgi:hypothetical protein